MKSCEGCKTIDYCPYNMDDLVTEICPCRECLVKSMCQTLCDSYNTFKNIAVAAIKIKRKRNEG